METSNWVLILATLLSPFIAVQVSQFIERRRHKRSEQVRIFSMLMATRGVLLDPRHVEALNLIDVTFHSKKRSDVEVRRLWKQYLDVLCQNALEQGWDTRRSESLVALLYGIAVYLGFDFDKTHIKNQAYIPQAWGNVEMELMTIRKALVEILSNRSALPVSIKDPVPPPAAEQRVERG